MTASDTAFDLGAAMKTLDGWDLIPEGTAMHKTFVWRNFNAAWGFMTRCALVAEQHNHHPDWFNSWNRVEVTLTTHAAGRVTEQDVRLATAMNRIAADMASMATV